MDRPGFYIEDKDERKRIDDIMEEVCRNIKKAIDKTFVSSVITDQTMTNIEYFVNTIIDKIYEKHPNIISRDKIEFKLEFGGKNEIIFKPLNLYSLLVANGIYIPYEWIDGKNSYETSSGTYVFRDGESIWKPNTPIEYVEVKFNINTKEEQPDLSVKAPPNITVTEGWKP